MFKSSNSSFNRKIIDREQANLARLLVKSPTQQIGSLGKMKHNFYILVNLAKEKIILDIVTVHKLPEDKPGLCFRLNYTIDE